MGVEVWQTHLAEEESSFKTLSLRDHLPLSRQMGEVFTLRGGGERRCWRAEWLYFCMASAGQPLLHAPLPDMGGDTSGGADAELASRCCGVQERNSWRGLGQAAVVFQAWEGAGQRPSWLCWRPWRAQLCFGQVRDWEKKRSLWIANTMRGSW